jgi:hypothetical protein
MNNYGISNRGEVKNQNTEDRFLTCYVFQPESHGHACRHDARKGSHTFQIPKEGHIFEIHKWAVPS